VLDPPVHDTPVEVLPGVVRLTAPNPSVMTGPGTNTYFVGHTDLVAIDPGRRTTLTSRPWSPPPAGASRPSSSPTPIQTTPRLGRPRRPHGARQLGYGARDGFEPDDTLGEGDVVEAGDIALTAVHTPRARPPTTCATSPTCPPATAPRRECSSPATTSWAVPLSSSGRPTATWRPTSTPSRTCFVLDPSITVIAPGHGSLMASPRLVIEGYLTHRRAEKPPSEHPSNSAANAGIEEIVGDVYTDVPEALHPIARFSGVAHLRKLAPTARRPPTTSTTSRLAGGRPEAAVTAAPGPPGVRHTRPVTSTYAPVVARRRRLGAPPAASTS